MVVTSRGQRRTGEGAARWEGAAVGVIVDTWNYWRLLLVQEEIDTCR